MSDLDDLTPEQLEQVLQFQDLTGVLEFPVCIEILRQCDWDLNLAVNEAMTGSEDRFTGTSPGSGAVYNAPIWLRVLQSVNFFGLRRLFEFVLAIIRNTPLGLWQMLGSNSRRIASDPVEDVLSFIHYYEQRYGNIHPVFYRGSYSQALNMAKQDLRFLLVYLHCDEHQDTTKFCEETLQNLDVIEYIDARMLFWACSVTSSEGYRVSQALLETTYPFLAVIALVEGRMAVIGRLEGALESADLITHLGNLIRDNEEVLALARAERHQRSLDQALRRQQDQAYLESLRADEEKERRKREEQEVKMQHELQKELVARQKIELASRIPEEPSEDDPGSVLIVFKLPNGMRLERRFLKTHSLKHLYYYVFCNPASPDSFEITTNFPKRVINCQDDVETLEEADLSSKELLFVRDLEA